MARIGRDTLAAHGWLEWPAMTDRARAGVIGLIDRFPRREGGVRDVLLVGADGQPLATLSPLCVEVSLRSPCLCVGASW